MRPTRETADPQALLPLSARKPWLALALTLLAPFAVLLAQRVTLPGVDAEALGSIKYPLVNFSLLALGVMPFITAAIVVEIVALISPPWQHLRHGGPEGRRKLSRATVLLAFALAVFQGWGISQAAAEVFTNPGMASALLVTVTLVAGVALTHLLAEVVSLRGLASGYGVLYASLSFLGIFTRFDDIDLSLAARDVLGTLVASAVIAAVTWFALERSTPAGTQAQKTATYREAATSARAPALALPSPASGLIPLTLGASIITLLISFGSRWFDVSWLLDDAGYWAVLLALVLPTNSVLTRLFNPPERVAEVFARARAEGAARAALEAEARAELGSAEMKAAVFVFAVILIELLASRFARISVSAWSVALAVALVLDIAAELRARRAMPDLVPVWPEHRPYAIAAAREALGAEDIPVHARGERLRRLLQFFGPYVPIDLMVPQAHAARAAKILNGVLRAREWGTTDETAKETRPRTAEEGPPEPRPIRVPVITGILLLAGCILALVMPAMTSPPEARMASVTLEFLSVDDEHEIVDDATREKFLAGEQPNGLSLQRESVPLGSDKQATRFYVELRRDETETLDAARARLEAWAKTLALPEGDRVAVGIVAEMDDESGTGTQTGWRTFLLKGAPILTAADVVEAKAMPDPNNGSWYVALKFGPDGAARFASYTGQNIRRRFAILVDGRVLSVPMIMARIPGGYASITMLGTGTVEQQKADAQSIARALDGD